MRLFFLACFFVSFSVFAKDEKSEKQAFNSEEIEEAQRLFDVVYTVKEEYYLKEYSFKELMLFARKGILNQLQDNYASYFSAPDLKRFDDGTQGIVGTAGIGIIKKAEKIDSCYGLEIAEVLSGSDLEARVKPGDFFIGVGSECFRSFDSLKNGLLKLEGEAGEKAELWFTSNKDLKNIRRYQTEYRDLYSSSLDCYYLSDYETVFFKMTSILKNHHKEVTECLLAYKDYKAIVFDLRNNVGGYVEATIPLLSIFFDSLPVFFYSSKENLRKAYLTKNKPSQVKSDIPIFILANGGTASSAEIFAGALSALGRASIVGEPSYGKGAVQQFYKLANGEGFKFTVGEYLVPFFGGLEGNGLKPGLFEQFDPESEMTDYELSSKRGYPFVYDNQIDAVLDLIVFRLEENPAN